MHTSNEKGLVGAERRQLPNGCNANERFHNRLIQCVPNVILFLSPDHLILEFNPEAERLYGRKREDVLGKDYFTEFLPENARHVVTADLEKVLAGEPTRNFENAIIAHDGREHILSWNVDRVLDSDNNPIGIIAVGQDITEREKAEETLQKSGEKYRTLFEGANDAIFVLEVIDNNLRFKECNSRTENMFGCRKEDIIGRSTVDFSPSVQPDGTLSVEKAAQLCATAMTGKPQHFEWKHCRLDGTEFYTEVSLNRIDIADKPCLQAIVRDITERKTAEELLRESENRYRSVVENAREGIAVAQDGILQFANPYLVNTVSYSEKELLSRPFIEFIHQDDREWVMEIHTKRFKGEEVPSVYEFRAVDKQGNTRWLENNGILIEWDRKPATLNFLRDITERKKTEIALRAAEELFSKAFHASPDAMAISRIADGMIIKINDAWEKLFGYSRAGTIGKTSEELGVFCDSAMRQKAVQLLRQTGSLRNFELDIRCKTGEVRQVILSSERLEIGGEENLITICHDITERNQAEVKLQEGEQTARALLNATTDLGLLIDREGIVIDLNDRMAEAMGDARENMIGTVIYHYLPADLAEQRKTIGLKAMRERKPIHFGDKRRNRWFENCVYPIFDPEGEVVRFAVYSRDITEQRKAEKRIQKYQKQLRSLASELSLAEQRERRRIATGIHDNIAQKLAMAKFRLQSLQASVKDNNISVSLEKQCELMSQVAADARSLTFELGNPVLYQVGLEAAVESYLTERIQAEFEIECKFKLEGPKSSLEEDVRVVLFQAVRELLANVIKHAKASTIEVCIRNNEDSIQIIVQDDGVGFNPKRIGPHTLRKGGFGLFNIRERLEYFGGNLEIESKLKSGTRVTMTVALRADVITE